MLDIISGTEIVNTASALLTLATYMLTMHYSIKINITCDSNSMTAVMCCASNESSINKVRWSLSYVDESTSHGS